MRHNNTDHEKQHFSSWKSSTFSSKITICSTTIQLARNPTEMEKNRQKQRNQTRVHSSPSNVDQRIWTNPAPVWLMPGAASGAIKQKSLDWSRLKVDLSTRVSRTDWGSEPRTDRLHSRNASASQEKHHYLRSRTQKITRGSMTFASPNTIMCQTGFIGIFYASVRRK